MRAQFNCFSDASCGANRETPVVYSSAVECCLQDDPSVLRSYGPVDGSAPCQECLGTSLLKRLSYACACVKLFGSTGFALKGCMVYVRATFNFGYTYGFTGT